MPTPHDNEGTQTRKTLRWLNETEGWKASAFTSRVEDDFRERTQWQLGKTRDPLVYRGLPPPRDARIANPVIQKGPHTVKFLAARTFTWYR